MTNHVHLIAVPDDPTSLALALGKAHSQYTLEVNRLRKSVGHLWQNRFYSCAMQESHLFRALQYVELNPVRAGLVLSAWEWPWSSALAHIHGIDDPLMTWDWQEWFRGGWDYAGWMANLGPELAPEDLQAIRRSTRNGEPFGSADFVHDLERQAGRSLQVRRRGRPRKEIVSDTFFTIGV
jgi:putative transposase